MNWVVRQYGVTEKSVIIKTHTGETRKSWEILLNSPSNALTHTVAAPLTLTIGYKKVINAHVSIKARSSSNLYLEDEGGPMP